MDRLACPNTWDGASTRRAIAIAVAEYTYRMMTSFALQFVEFPYFSYTDARPRRRAARRMPLAASTRPQSKIVFGSGAELASKVNPESTTPRKLPPLSYWFIKNCCGPGCCPPESVKSTLKGPDKEGPSISANAL